MAGFGARSYGRGKRMPPQSQSSSSYFSIITLVIFLAFCLLGVWMLTTSSVVPAQVITNTAHRTFRGFVSSSLPSLKGNDDEDTRPRDLVHEGIVKDVRAGSGGDDDDETTRVEGGGDKLVVEDLASVIKLPGEDGGGKEGGGQEEQVGTDEGQREQKEESGEGGGEAKRVGSEEEGQSRQESEEGEQKIQKTEEEGVNEQLQVEQTAEEKTQVDEGQQQVEQPQDNDQGQKGGGEESRQSSDAVPEDVKGSDVERNEESGNDRSDKVEDSEKQDVGTDGEGRSLESGGGEPTTDSTTTTDTESGETQQQSSQEQTQSDGGDREEGANQEQQDRSSEVEEGKATTKDQDKADLLENLGGDSVGEGNAEQTEGKDTQKGGSSQSNDDNGTVELGSMVSRSWEICNVTAGHDYIPCLDNEEALKHVRITGHYEHRERHCPDEGPTCLVSLPDGYRKPIEWPRSRDKIWYNNVPHKKLAEVKGHQNWMKVAGENIIFPGGGTQFIHGALHYIDFIQKAVPRIAWGKHTRVILDVGCGVASFGGYLFERDVIAMSFAPKDEHEAQVQFALERGIPAISAVMGTQRLPFPSAVFDIVHCARCRVPWHVEGGRLLLELNRVLRPGGYFVWSATPVYQKLKEDVEIWNAMSTITKSMCWDLVTIKKDRINSVGAAIFRKPVSNECYDHRQSQSPPMCKDDDDANAAWYIPLQSCMHRVPIHSSQRGSQWPADWPRRLHVPPYWLNKIQKGIYGKSEPEDFKADSEHWKRIVEKSYINAMGINWSKVRNVMDMRAVYGGFAAALKDMKLWVMNVVNIDSVDTLPIIFERGLFGIYHDWCESFSTYPRTYDLLHADHLFSRLKKRCHLLPVIVEVDRILRPGGTFIIRDESAIVSEVENMLKSLHWDVRLTFSKSQEGILCAEKSDWRPEPFPSAS